MDLDEFLQEVGDRGKYQNLMLWLVFLPAQLSFGCHAYSTLFMIWTPQHWCRVQELRGVNMSDSLIRHLTIPKLNGSDIYSQCEMYDLQYDIRASNDTIRLQEPNFSWKSFPCSDGWTYNRSTMFDRETAVTKWDLVCSRSGYITILLLAFITSIFMGQCVCHLLVARIGKRACFFIFLFAQCAGGISTAFSPNFISFAVSRCLVGLTVAAMLIPPHSMAFEIISSDLHGFVTVLCFLARSIGVCMLAGATFFVQDYSNLALAITVPFLVFFLYGWVFPESPGWLLSTGRYEEAGRLLRNIATTNGTRLSPDYVVSMQRRFRIEMALQEERQKETGGHTVCDLVSTPNMRRKFVLLIFIWSFSSTSVTGLSYLAFHVQPGEEVQLKYTACALAELLAIVVAVGILYCVGRRCAFFITCAFSASMCLFTIFCSSRMGWLIPIISHASAKMFSQASFIILNIWTREQLPVVVREAGFRFIETTSLMFPTLVPYIHHQGKKFDFVALWVFGISQLTCALLALCLPETRHMKALQTLHDAEVFGKYWKWQDCFRKPKTDQKNGIVKSLEKRPQSPILGLLRKRDSFHRANADGEIEVLECHSDACSAEEAVKVTVL